MDYFNDLDICINSLSSAYGKSKVLTDSFCEAEEGVHIRICISLEREIVSDGERFGLKYSLFAEEDEYRPFGISAELKDSTGNVIETGRVRRLFSTLDETVNIMMMCMGEEVLPCTIEDILT